MSKKATGCESLYLAELKTVDGVETFETPVQVKDLESVSITNTYAEGKNYADNKENIYMKKQTGAEISITLSELKKEIEALVMGKSYQNGEMVSKTTDIQKQVAVLYKKTYSDGSYDLNVYYNCKLAKDDDSQNTEGENIEFTAVTLSGKASPLSTGEISYTISSDEVALIQEPEEKTAMEEKVTNFFTEVQKYTTV